MVAGAAHGREQKGSRGHGPLLQRHILRMVRLIEIMFRLHLNQAAGGAGKFAGGRAFGI